MTENELETKAIELETKAVELETKAENILAVHEEVMCLKLQIVELTTKNIMLQEAATIKPRGIVTFGKSSRMLESI